MVVVAAELVANASVADELVDFVVGFQPVAANVTVAALDFAVVVTVVISPIDFVANVAVAVESVVMVASQFPAVVISVRVLPMAEVLPVSVVVFAKDVVLCSMWQILVTGCWVWCVLEVLGECLP